MGGPWENYQPQETPAASDGPWAKYAASKPSSPDMFDTVSDNALQGATFGLGNRAASGLAALVQTGINGKPVSENYKAARDTETQRLGDEMQQHPVVSIAANIGGALATGGLGADTAAGSAITNSLRSGNTLARVGKGALAGSVSGAAYGAGTAGYDQSLEGAKQGAITGAVTGGAIPAAGAVLSDVGGTLGNAAKGVLARSPDAVQDAAESLKSKASDLYNQMRQVGATLNPASSTSLSSNVDSAVAANQFIPELNPKTLAIVNHLKAAAQNGNLGLNDLDQYRRLLGRVGGSEDGVSAGAVRQAIDDHVNSLTGKDLSSGSTDAVDLLNQGRKQYQQASKFEDISEILTKADGDPNKIKAGLTRFLNNEKNTRGWSGDELKALKDAASSTGTEKLLKMGGKFGIDLGTSLTPGNTIGPVLGGAVGGLGAPVAGTAARIGQKLSARGGAENLLTTLQNGGGKAASQPISGVLSAPAGGIAQQIKSNGGQPTAPIPPALVPQSVTMQPMSYNTQAPEPDVPDVSSFAKAESSNNPNARNPHSSASGLYGFTNKTWADMVARYGKQTGIDLGDKNNSQAQTTMVGLLAKDNIKSLNSTLGRMPSKGELYMAHVLGASGAAKLINADPNQEAIMLYPRQVLDANRSIFFDDKQPRTAGEVQQLLASKV